MDDNINAEWGTETTHGFYGILPHAIKRKGGNPLSVETVKKGQSPFLTKGLQSAARTICAPLAYKSHTCILIGIFCQVQEVNCPEGARETTLGCAPTENDQNLFTACRRQTLRGFFDTLTKRGKSPFRFMENCRYPEIGRRKNRLQGNSKTVPVEPLTQKPKSRYQESGYSCPTRYLSLTSRNSAHRVI